MQKKFFWRFVLCLTPCVLAGIITFVSITRYTRGEPGGFKFGVDLVGGTILVYEIDWRKQLASQQGLTDGEKLLHKLKDKENKSWSEIAQNKEIQEKFPGSVIADLKDTYSDVERKLEQQFDPETDTNILAAALKRRIDPNDLYNIIIRPAPGEGRVEIIIPTGGTYRSKKADDAWRKVLKLMSEAFFPGENKKLDAPRGRIYELAEQIHAAKTQAKWKGQIFTKKDAWKVLLDNVADKWQNFSAKSILASLYFDKKSSAYIKKTKVDSPAAIVSIVGLATPPNPMPQLLFDPEFYGNFAPAIQLRNIKPGDLAALTNIIKEEIGADTSEKAIEFFIKQQAWNLLLTKAQDKWPQLKEYKTAMERIPDDKTKRLTMFIHAGGNVINQAGLSMIKSLLGKSPIKTDVKKPFVSLADAEKFVKENYGPSLDEITDKIKAKYQQSGQAKDLTIEEVQRIKELVSRVGSLEFRILANQVDDKKAIADIKRQMQIAHKEGAKRKELDERQKRGLPPPGPLDGDKLREYEISLPRGYKSTLSYDWIELGPQQRKELGLDNAAENEPRRGPNWQLMAKARIGQAGKEGDQYVTELFFRGKKQFQGAVFYSRECRDLTMSPEERAKKKYEYFIFTRKPEIEKGEDNKIDGKYLTQAGSDISQGRPAVNFRFNAGGARLFGKLTRKNVPSGSGADKIRRHLAIILDGLVMTAPTINSEIRDSGQITGSFTKLEVDSLVNILRSGALPASLKPQPVSESTMGASLGRDTIQSGFKAVVWALVAVLVFMTIYYRFAGFVASIALLANLLLTVGFMVAVNATFTLPGLAGLVLMLGMAVDANVLIYERIREERDRGSTLALSIRNGYIRAFPPIIDTHLSSIFTAIVLYVVGNDQLKGFAISLTVGLAISLFTSLYMTRTLFDFWHQKGWLTKLGMFRLLQKPDLDFMGVRHYLFAFTIVLAIAGFALFIGRMPNDLGIDFTGGTAYGGKLVKDKAQNITELRKLFSEGRQKERLKEKIQFVKKTDEKGLVFDVKFKDEEQPRRISLVKEPKGDTKEEWENDIVIRLSAIPDISVEQIFPSFDKQEPGKSRYFTIRTSEKETEIVQAGIDRLLQEKGVSILDKVYVHFEPLKANSRGTALAFYAKNPPKQKFDKKEFEPDRAYGSPSYVKTLFTKAMLAEFKVKDKEDLPQFDFLGDGGSKEGRRQILNLKFSKDLNADQLKKVNDALIAFETQFETRPQPERLENFDSQLAADTRFRAMWAILASWVAVMCYLWFRFGNWTFGLAAVVCLVHDLFLTLGIIAACHFIYASAIGQALLLQDFKVDLPAVAAFLTLVGYSVADTIVVFDRIREVRGKNPDLTSTMINDSVNQCLSRTILTSLTTFLVVGVLYWFGGPGIHLFAFIMVIGVLVGTYSSIYIASPLLLIFGEGVKATEQTPVTKTETAVT